MAAKFPYLFPVLLIACCALPSLTLANTTLAEALEAVNDSAARDPGPPPPLSVLQNLPKENPVKEGESGLPFDIRKDALREAALSYGARGGLARRTYEIRQQLRKREPNLDQIFDFSQLLIPAPSGFMIEPPVISESVNAMIIDGGGQEAAVSDRIYNIVSNAKIASTARTWRQYLERE